MTTERICIEPGCNKLGQHIGKYYKTGPQKGLPMRRQRCHSCHSKKTAKRHGLKRMSQVVAKKAGLTETQYKNKYHPYLRYRKTYCENQDSRLGFKCNTVLPTEAMLKAAGVNWTPMQFLQVDHIDGNHSNNDPKNLQTLCVHCHAIKSVQNGDHLTPGRKTRIL